VAYDVNARAGTPTCPDCGAPVRPDQDALCPRCGYPLMFLRSQPVSDGPVRPRAPGERGETTIGPGPDRVTATARVAGYEPPPPGYIVCPQCYQANPPTRIRCERCGRELRPQPLLDRPPPPPLPQPSPRRSPPFWLIAFALVAVMILAGVVTGVLIHNRQQPQQSGGGGESPLLRIDASTIRPSASRTLTDPPTFGVANTIDGNPATAWQSHGKPPSGNVGVRLTYTFDRPVKLARITLVNGYAQSAASFGRNERLKSATVTTDSGSQDWHLPDTDRPQTLDLDRAATKSVVLVVREVYLGTRFQDLAVSEIAFDAVP
jgi:ribosomal protein L37E